MMLINNLIHITSLKNQSVKYIFHFHKCQIKKIIFFASPKKSFNIIFYNSIIKLIINFFKIFLNIFFFIRQITIYDISQKKMLFQFNNDNNVKQTIFLHNNCLVTLDEKSYL